MKAAIIVDDAIARIAELEAELKRQRDENDRLRREVRILRAMLSKRG